MQHLLRLTRLVAFVYHSAAFRTHPSFIRRNTFVFAISDAEQQISKYALSLVCYCLFFAINLLSAPFTPIMEKVKGTHLRSYLVINGLSSKIVSTLCP